MKRSFLFILSLPSVVLSRNKHTGNSEVFLTPQMYPKAEAVPSSSDATQKRVLHHNANKTSLSLLKQGEAQMKVLLSFPSRDKGFCPLIRGSLGNASTCECPGRAGTPSFCPHCDSSSPLLGRQLAVGKLVESPRRGPAKEIFFSCSVMSATHLA